MNRQSCGWELLFCLLRAVFFFALCVSCPFPYVLLVVLAICSSVGFFFSLRSFQLSHFHTISLPSFPHPTANTLQPPQTNKQTPFKPKTTYNEPPLERLHFFPNKKNTHQPHNLLFFVERHWRQLNDSLVTSITSKAATTPLSSAPSHTSLGNICL